MSSVLPGSAFATIRGALKVLRAERQAFGRSQQDVDYALRILWERQLSFPWEEAVRQQMLAKRDMDLPPHAENTA